MHAILDTGSESNSDSEARHVFPLSRNGPLAGKHALFRAEKANGYDYHVCLHCFDQPKQFYTYPFSLSDPLPEIGVPLLPGDPVITVELQAIFDRSYDVGGFARDVDYTSETPEPPLTDEQMQWARERLRAAGKLGEPQA